MSVQRPSTRGFNKVVALAASVPAEKRAWAIETVDEKVRVREGRRMKGIVEGLQMRVELRWVRFGDER